MSVLRSAVHAALCSSLHAVVALKVEFEARGWTARVCCGVRVSIVRLRCLVLCSLPSRQAGAVDCTASAPPTPPHSATYPGQGMHSRLSTAKQYLTSPTSGSAIKHISLLRPAGSSWPRRGSTRPPPPPACG